MATANYWTAEDMLMSFPQLYVLPKISHPKLHPDNFKFEKTQALVSYPAVFENTAETLGKYVRRKGYQMRPPPPPPPESEDGKDRYEDRWEDQLDAEGWTERREPQVKEWIQVGGHWYRRAT